MPENQYDIILLGGGCAALNFAMAFANSKSLSQRVLIIERRVTYHHDRNWSFWLKNDVPFDHQDCVKSTWASWRFSDLESDHIHASDYYIYATVASGDFYNKAQALIRDDPRQTLLSNCAVEKVYKRNDESFYSIQTSYGEFFARTVIDTRNIGFEELKKRAAFYQIFYGYEIETETPTFDTSSVGLMEHIEPNQGGLSFIYTLPFSKTQALIEYTAFTKTYVPPTTLETELNNYMEELFPDHACQVTARESAVLPMGKLQTDPIFQDPAYIHFGGAAGSLRESSGYGFLRLHHWAKNAVKSLENGSTDFNSSSSTVLNRFMDRHFIKTLRHNPWKSPYIFMALARNTSADVFARFMSDQHSLKDLIHVILAVPKTPFIKALFQS